MSRRILWRRLSGRKTVFVPALFCLILLGGCEKEIEEWSPVSHSAVDVGADGSVTEYLSDRFDEDYYQFDELRKMLDDEVSAYNSAAGSERILIEEASGQTETGEPSVRLVIRYLSASDYSGFNQEEFYSGTVIGAQLAGYALDASYTRVRDGAAEGAGYTVDDVLDHSEDYVVMVNDPMEIHVNGEIEFISDGVRLISSDTAVFDGFADTEDPAAEKTFHPAYIIYRF